MKEYKILLFSMCMLFVAASCYKDQGNYAYSELENISIENIEESYTLYYMKDRLKIKPVVSSNMQGADMTYSWTYNSYKDTIATGAELDTLVTWLPGKNHRITFRAMNKHTGYTKTRNLMLHVNTPFLNAWHVLKDDGENSELDMYDYLEHTKTENIITLVNGEGQKVKGKGTKLVFIPDHDVFNEETNRFEGVKTIFVMTNQDVVGVNTSQFNVVRDYENMFIEAPEEAPAPNFIGVSVYSHIFVNAGQVYTSSAQSVSNGQFGMKKLMNLDNDPYCISKFVLNDWYLNQLVFDDLNSSFYVVSNYNAQMRNIPDDPNTEMSATNNGKQLLYMGINKLYMVNYAYAVMQDKLDTSLKMITRVEYKYGKSDLSLRNDTLQPGVDQAYDGKLFTMAIPEQGLYFIANNKLYYRSVASKDGAESMEFEIPNQEQATFIRCVSYGENAEGIAHKYVVLGTQLGSGYQLRFFRKTTAGHIDPIPEFTLPRSGETAEGTARDVIFVSPNTSLFSAPIHSW